MVEVAEDANGKNKHSEAASDAVDGDTGSQQRARSFSCYSADLETAITKTGCGKFNYALLLLSFFVSCASCFDSGSVSFIIPAASVDLDLTPSERALLQSSCHAGMMFSGIIWGFLSDAFGRKKLLVISFFSNALMNVLAGVFPIFPLIVIFKFLAGFMIGGPFPIFTAYVSEVYPTKGRDAAVLSIGFYSVAGQILQAGLATWIIPAQVPNEIPFKSWQLFMIACSLPALVSGIGCLFFVESPKFLADKGNHEGALKVCQTIYSINTGNLSSTYPIKRLNYTSRKTDNEKKSNLSKILEGTDLFKPPFVQRALLMFSIYLMTVGSYNTLRLWLPEMLTLVSSSTLHPEKGFCPMLEEGNLWRSNLTSEDLKSEEVFSTMILVYSCSLLGQLVFLFVVGYLGMKKIQLSCVLTGAVCTLVIPFIKADYVIILVSIFMTLYDICIICIIKMVVEIFPTRIRVTSVSVLSLTSRFGTLLFNFLIANVIYNYCEYLFCGLSLTGLVIMGLLFIAARDPIEEKIFNPSKGQ